MGTVVFLLFLQIAVPVAMLIGFWRRRDWTRRDLALAVLLNGSYVAFIYFLVPWGFVSYYFRLLWPLLFLLAVVRAGIMLRRAEVAGAERKHRVSAVVCLVAAGILLFRVAAVIPAGRYSGTALDLEFPLRDGTAMVGHGGNHPVLNYHNVHAPQRFALDISGLNTAGLRSSDLSGKQLERYAIWGRTLHSPCEGIVESVVSDLPDHVPPASDPEQPAGNHIEIRTGEYRVFLAHMQRGSALVKKGDQVARGQPLGKVGNSGNTSEPHLHIHAVRGGTGLHDGAGVPITFQGRFLLRNDVWFGAGPP